MDLLQEDLLNGLLKKGVLKMKRKICGLLIGISLVLFIGIIGGVSDGEPLRNALWCIPALLVTYGAAKVGGYLEED